LKLKLLVLFPLVISPNVGSILFEANIVYVPFCCLLTLFTFRVLVDDVIGPNQDVVASGLLLTEQVMVKELNSFTSMLFDTDIGDPMLY
jgi:hypothetical protein